VSDTKKDNNDTSDADFGYKVFPSYPADLWSKIHDLPVKQHICTQCKKIMWTSKPFILKEKEDSLTSWVGLTTEDAGYHKCSSEYNISVGKYIVDKSGESYFWTLYKKLMKGG
jgi:hypothetical protein